MAPQRHGDELVHIALEHISQGQVSQMVAQDLEKEKKEKNGVGSNGKDAKSCQNVVPRNDQAEGSDTEDGRQDENW